MLRNNVTLWLMTTFFSPINLKAAEFMLPLQKVTH